MIEHARRGWRSMKAGDGRRDPIVLFEIDLLRFFAATMVVMYHFAFFSWHEDHSPTGVRAAIGHSVSFEALVPYTWFGWVGVEIFFVISGFVIAGSMERQSATGFARSRVLRLAPALWFFATLSLAVTAAYSPLESEALAPLYVKSLFLFPKGPWIDGVYWTLTVECVFYTAVFCIMAMKFSHFQKVVLAFALLGCSFYLLVLASLLSADFGGGRWSVQLANMYGARLLLLTTGPYFVVGLLIFWIYRYGVTAARLVGLGASLLAGIVGIWFNARGTAGVTLRGQPAIVPAIVWLLASLAILISLLCRGTRSSPLSLNSLSRTLGLATYPLYLFHNISGAFAFGVLLGTGMDPYFSLGVAYLGCVLISIGFAVHLEPRLRVALDRLLQFCLKLVEVATFRSPPRRAGST